MPSGRPSIGSDFHERIDAFLRQHPELGYQTTAELVRDLLRRWLEEQKHGAGERDSARAPSALGMNASPPVQ